MAAPEQARPVVASSFFHRSATGIAVSVVVAVALALLIFRDVDGLLTRTVAGSLEAEADAIGQLAVSGGVGAVQSLLQSRQHATGGSVVALSDAAGRVKVGLLGAMPAEVIANPAGGMFRYTSSQPAVPPSDRRAVGILRTLPDGARLMVARDVEEQLRAITRIRLTLAVGLAVLALAGLGAGYSASRRVVERVERVNATARAIMAGDMRERIPIASAGDEIDELSRNLNDMLDRIEQLMAGLREISDNIAHDLKTPLNRLRNRAEAALRDAAECDELRDALARAIEEADDLIKVFNAMLLIARLEAGALEGQTDRFDCGALVRDVAELYEPVAEAAGLTFEVSIADGLMVEANRQLVGQAVANLLDNAIKYSSDPRKPVVLPAGMVRGVRVEVTSTSQQGVAITVSDRGPGVPAEDRERVLRRFVRLEQSRSLPGTGLGLSLVAAVARLHGGSIALGDNAPGLVIVLKLPWRPASGEHPA